MPRAARFALQALGRSNRRTGAGAPTVSRLGGTHRAPRILMMTMKTVKRTFNHLGDTTGDLARTTGDFARTIGSDTVDLARQFGGGTAKLAKRIGPKRGLIGLAVLAAAIGGSVVLIRYLRARSAQDGLAADESNDVLGNGFAKKRARAQHAAESFVSRQ
jgi:hypothetical protein